MCLIVCRSGGFCIGLLARSVITLTEVTSMSAITPEAFTACGSSFRESVTPKR